MSQKAAAGQGTAAAGCRGVQKPRYFHRAGRGTTKGYTLSIAEIKNNTFNTGHNKFAAQLTQSRRNVANYLARNKSGVTFLQRSGQGHGGQGAHGNRTGGRGKLGADVGGGSLVLSGGEQGQARRTNQAGDSHCYNCGSLDHWALQCPELSCKQQVQLHMMVQGNKDQDEDVDKGH
jgi:hypothetical protein